MISLPLAWKNLSRKKARTAVLLSAIGLSFASALMSAAWNDGFQRKIIEEAVDLDLGHGQVHMDGWLLDQKQSRIIPESSTVGDVVRKTPGIESVSLRGIASAMASTSAGSYGVNLVGINPADEASVTTLDDSLSEGVFLEKPMSAYIGKKLASKLRIGTGKKIVVTFQNARGELSGASFKVTGLFQSASADFDESSVFVPLPDFAELTGYVDGVQKIVFRAEPGADLAALIARLRETLARPDLDVRSWDLVQPDFAKVAAMNRSVMGVFLMIITLAVGFALANIMLMIVQERSREIAMLKAVGMRGRIASRSIMAETLLIYLIGGASGLALAWLGVEAFSLSGIQALYLTSDTVGGYFGYVALFGIVTAWIAGRRVRRVRLPEGIAGR